MKTVLTFAIAVGGLLSVTSSAGADPFTFTTISVPGAFNTDVWGINDAGQIVGTFDFNQGFVRDTVGTFTTINVPGASSTDPFSINSMGQIVGTFRGAGAHGFLDASGSLTTIDVPGALNTFLRGGNDFGQFVGSCSGGTCGTGFFVGPSFLYSGGVFSAIAVPVPGAQTSVQDINDSGQIVGYYTSNGSSDSHGFLDIGGTFTTIDVPGAAATQALGINNAGQIVGWFNDSTGRHGFLDTGGVFTTLDIAGAGLITEAYGINDSGQIVGRSNIGTSLYFNGFLATPVPEPASVPEPSSLLLLGTGLAFLARWRRVQARQRGSKGSGRQE